MHVAQIAEDLRHEQLALDAIVAPLDEAQWRLATPSPRWTIADQIAHLTFFDESAARAITDPAAFAADLELLIRVSPEGDEAVDDATMGDLRRLPPAELLERWQDGRRRLAEAAATLEDDTRVSWYGPSMGAKSFLTARLMEVWAHGQDVVDALRIQRVPTDRLRHIAQLGFITRSWSYLNRGLTAPDEPVRIELEAPGDATWSFGPEDAAETITGPADDFCLVVTQRRHLDDTSLTATPLAREWLLIAQAFAGPATDGPAAGTRG